MGFFIQDPPTVVSPSLPVKTDPPPVLSGGSPWIQSRLRTSCQISIHSSSSCKDNLTCRIRFCTSFFLFLILVPLVSHFHTSLYPTVLSLFVSTNNLPVCSYKEDPRWFHKIRSPLHKICQFRRDCFTGFDPPNIYCL